MEAVLATPRIYVDIVDDECSPLVANMGRSTFTPEVDGSTDCSESSWQSGDWNWGSDEEDEDCNIVEVGSDVEVHAEIDEEDDDDLFFSTHRKSRCHIACSDAEGVQNFSIADSDDEETEEEEDEGCKLACNDVMALGDSPTQCSSSSDAVSQVSMVLRPRSPSTADKKSVEAVEQRRSSAPAICLRVVDGDEDIMEKRDSDGFLGKLQGGRAQGVRNFLAKKLSKEGEAL